MSRSVRHGVASLLAVAAVGLVVIADAVTAGPMASGAKAAGRVTSGKASDPEDLTVYRLPRHFLPNQYTLRLEPDMNPSFEGENRVFKGLVTIQVTAQDVTNVITLHASAIEVKEAHVRRLQGDQQTGDNLIERVELQENYEFLKLHLRGNVEEGAFYMITIEYIGKLWDDMYGFYVSTYKDENNQEKLLVATQFQATYARRAFPCFDEPNFKARFLVTIIAPQEMNVLSNMPVLTSIGQSNGLKEVNFENTMTMSSYLLAFVVAPFESVEDTGSEGDVHFKTWARPEALNWTEYSLEVSRPMLNTLEEYTNIEYRYSNIAKIDQVALPDFAAGAMENWGLITYRETALLYNGGPAGAKKRVATVIAHELLHMWFGNLVTTDWWDTTWLNEGFARFFQYYVTDKVEVTWRMWDQFLVDQHQMVFALDAVPNAEALTHDVYTPAQVSASFGSITYNKGASVLRMISHTIGAPNFQTALQVYLKENEYKNTRPSDLFDKLKVYAANANLSEQEFVKFLRSWTETPGYPVVTVKRDYPTNRCTLSQVRYLLKEEGIRDEEYYVPITWTKKGQTFDDTVPTKYLVPGSTLVIDNMPDNTEWVIFNVQETGYYRVNYDKHNWQLLASHLQDINRPLDDVHLLNRAQLLDDAFNLARVGLLDYETAFQVADYLPRETDYVPWAAAITAFSYLDRMLANHEKYSVLQRYILRLVDKIYRTTRVKQDTIENSVDKLFYNRVATLACSHGDKICTGGATLQLRNYLNDLLIPIPADLRSFVYCYGIRYADDYTWSALWSMYTESKDDVERELIINGLSCSFNENRLIQILERTIEGQYIRKQDASNVFIAVYSNPTGVDIALQFLQDRFPEVAKFYGSMGAINNIVTGIAGRLTTEDQLHKLQAFVSSYSDSLGSAGTAAIEIVEDNLRWLRTYQQTIFSILEEKELMKYRLPQTVSPIEYVLRFDFVPIEITSYLGEVSIWVVAEKSTDTIVLHAGNVEASKTVVNNYYSEICCDIHLASSYDDRLQYQYIYLSENLVPGRIYRIDINFFAFYRYDMYGVYKSSYVDENGIIRQLIATQFQPTHARTGFPCFDEPTHKTPFTVSMRIPPNFRALGNMQTRHIRVGEDKSLEVVFFPTPKMSTYLLAFVVSDFVYEEDADGDVLFRTWARPEAREWANYSLVVSRDILQQLEMYTGIPYTDQKLNFPLTKVDQVALPDFSAGAMENWGLVTYRETALLYNDGTASARKSVATIITHELAHMWFGNLVTTDWWDATWLNEGFAQYLQYFITDKVKPSWRLMDQFVVDHHQAVFASDSLSTSVALTYPAYTPAQVSARFSGITYSKGASVLRMIRATLGEATFQEVLQSYLNTYSYGTTKPEHLFEHFISKSSSSGLSDTHFHGFLRSWTEKPGFPVVYIDRDYDKGTAKITQHRFLLKPESEDSTLYYVPLTWTKEGGNFTVNRPQKYLDNEQKSIDINVITEIGANANEWILVNVQETGYYRVNYDDRNWKLISDFLQEDSKPLKSIHVLNRAQLLDDAFNLARAGQLSYQTALHTAEYLVREMDYVPWASALSAFSFLQRMLINDERYIYFKDYVLHLVKDLYTFYQFQDHDEHVDKLLLNRISAWACSLGLEHCIKSATDTLLDYLNNEKTVPADLRTVTYCYGIRHSSVEYWDEMMHKYMISKDNAERSIIMAGLACTQDESRLEELLLNSINENIVRRQDSSSVFSAVYGNTVGVKVALEFLDEYFTEIQTYYGSMGAINNIVIGISGRLTTPEQRMKLHHFVEKHRESLGLTADNALEIVDENLQWLSEYGNTILNYLETKACTEDPSSCRTTSVLVTTETQDPTLDPTSTQDPTPDQTSTQDPTPYPTSTQDPTPDQTSTQDPTPDQTSTQDPTPDQTSTQDPTTSSLSPTSVPTSAPTTDNSPNIKSSVFLTFIVLFILCFLI